MRSQPILVRLRPYGAFNGWVIDHQGNPVLSALIVLERICPQSPMGLTNMIVTAKEGRFSMPLPPGEAVFVRKVVSGVGPPLRLNEDISLGPGEVRTRVYRMPPFGTVVGSVTDQDGCPVPGLRVWLDDGIGTKRIADAAIACRGPRSAKITFPGRGGDVTWPDEEAPIWEGRTDSEGKFEIGGVPCGLYALMAEPNTTAEPALGQILAQVAINQHGARVERVIRVTRP